MAQDNDSLDRSTPGRERDGNAASPGAPSPGGGAGEFTRMFRSLGAENQEAPATPPAAERPPFADSAPTPQPAVPGPSPNLNLDPNSGSSGSEGFTQIFQQIKTPTSAPPQIRKPEPSAAASSSDGFTQIFSSFQAGTQPARAAAEPAGTVGTRNQEHRVSAPVAPSPSPAFAPPAARPAPSAAPPAPPTSVPAPAPVVGERTQQPGEFTHIFAQTDRGRQVAAASPPPKVESDSIFGAPARQGSLTETFRSPLSAQAPAPAQQGSDVFARPGASVPASAGSGAVTSDGLTEIFPSPVAPPPAPVQPAEDAFGRAGSPYSAPPPAPAAAPSGDGFTQLFQSLSATPAPFAPPVPSSAPAREPAFGSTPAPVFPAPRAAAPAPAMGGGDFTRLMQNLEQPTGAPDPAQQPAAPSPFFAEAPPAGGASEFTRVMRGASSRDGGAAGQAAPAVASPPVAPGLAIAPGKTEGKAEEKPAGKSKKMVILLVILNLLLLLAVLVLVFVLLRRH